MPSSPSFEDSPSNQFVVEACVELPEGVVHKRWQDVNRLLALSMLSGQQMQLDATLSHLCDQARQIAEFDHALTYFWNEKEDRFALRSCVAVDEKLRATQGNGNLFNLW